MFPRITIPPELRRVTTEELLAQPEIRAIGERIAAKTLETRRDLAAQLAQVSGEAADRKCAASVRATADAEAKVAAAQSALDEAKRNRDARLLEQSTTAESLRWRRLAIERELLASADPRLDAFLGTLDRVFFEARPRVTVEFVPPPPGPSDAERLQALKKRIADATDEERRHFELNGWFRGGAKGEVKQLATNAQRVASVLELIREMRPEVEAARLQALDAAEVGQRLDVWREKLRRPLDRVGVFLDEPAPLAAA